ncbi:hypothetical protein C0992_004511 [Termitomyces sp. T32_za158]|nr:hypothetical protein C0992_004511 [Termitomyces sp. T32_za158]
MLASRFSAYTHIVISLCAVLLFQAFPSWATAKPPARLFTRKRRSSSVTSSTSTLVGTDNSDAAPKKDASDPQKGKAKHRVSFSTKIPFTKLNLKDAISRGKSIKPKVPRRFSLPARRFSAHIVTALNNLTPRHRRPEEGADSYFSAVVEVAAEAEIEIEAESHAHAHADNVNVKENAADVTMAEGKCATPVRSAAPIAVAVSIARRIKVEQVVCDRPAVEHTESHVTVGTPHRKRTFKQFARRASVILGDIRVRRHRS